MSTWISEPLARPHPGPALRRAALGLAALTAAGCMPAAGGFGLLPFGPRPAPAPEMVVADGVAVAGPEGYCVDPVGTRQRGGAAFVLFGACAALTGEGRLPARRAVLSAAVSPPGDGPAVAGDAAAMVAFFETAAGRALLSRSGEAAAVRLISSEMRDGVLYLRLTDSSPFEGATVAGDYWRALFDVGPHVISLSAIPLQNRPLGPEGTRALLESFVARTRAANAAAASAAADGVPEAAPSAPEMEQQGLDRPL